MPPIAITEVHSSVIQSIGRAHQAPKHSFGMSMTPGQSPAIGCLMLREQIASSCFWMRRQWWRSGIPKRHFSPKEQRKLLAFYATKGPAHVPTIIKPLGDRVLAAVPLTIYERVHDYRKLLRRHDIKITLNYEDGVGFSALRNEVTIGVDGLEKAWAYAYVCTGLIAQAQAGTPYAITGPEPATLEAGIEGCLAWAKLTRIRFVYSPELPQPRADYLMGTPFDIYLGNSFVAAMAWVTLHEIAHVVLGHSFRNAINARHTLADELAADRWATEWLLAITPSDHDLVCRLNGIALGVTIAGYFEIGRTLEGERDHPHLPERLRVMLDRVARRCPDPRQQRGLWLMAAHFIRRRARIGGFDHLVDDRNLEANPRDYVTQFEAAYPDV